MKVLLITPQVASSHVQNRAARRRKHIHRNTEVLDWCPKRFANQAADRIRKHAPSTISKVHNLFDVFDERSMYQHDGYHISKAILSLVDRYDMVAFYGRTENCPVCKTISMVLENHGVILYHMESVSGFEAMGLDLRKVQKEPVRNGAWNRFIGIVKRQDLVLLRYKNLGHKPFSDIYGSLFRKEAPISTSQITHQ